MATNDNNQADVVILGGGSGGYAAAFRAAELGQRVILVERDKVGGTCLHYGCIPTKALLHSAEVADLTRASERFGVTSSFSGIDMAGVHGYKDGIVGRLYKGLQGLVKAHDITLVEGSGRLVDSHTVEVDGVRYTGRHVIIATGSYAHSLPGLDVDGDRILTSYEALTLDRVPESVIVLGGGVIGVEFASVWRSFGAEVTVVEALPRLVPGEDQACSKAVERAFRKRGMTIKTGGRLDSAQRTDQGVTVTLEGGETLQAEILLVAVGRGPATGGLGLAEAGIGLAGEHVATDERLRTSADGVYAVGDVVAGLQLAHRGFAHGIFVAEDIAGLNPTPVDDAAIPRVTYSDPEIASVGLTEAAARERLGADKVVTLDYNLAGNGKSQILGTQGFVKVVQEADGPVLGVHMVGARVGELISEAQLIYTWEAMPVEVAELIHPHPTQSEALGEAHLALAGKPLHVHA